MGAVDVIVAGTLGTGADVIVAGTLGTGADGELAVTEPATAGTHLRLETPSRSVGDVPSGTRYGRFWPPSGYSG